MIANQNILKIGDKIEISTIAQLEQQKKTGEPPKVFVSQILDLKEDSTIEIAMPFEGTKIVLLPIDLRYQFTFYSAGGMYRANVAILERYKKDNFFMLRIKLTTALERIQRREFYRLEIGLDVSFWFISEEEAKLDDVESVYRVVRERGEIQTPFVGKTMDLSGGGVRMLVGTKKPLPQLQDSQYLLLSIGLKSEDIEEPIDMVAKLLKSTRFVREGEVYYEFRVCFITKNKRDCEKIVKFVFQEERKNRKVK